MREAMLQTSKYDGSLHYRFPVRIVHACEEVTVTHRPPGVPMQSYRGNWQSSRHLMGFYWPDRYHNLCIMWKGDWTPEHHYVNIATPAEWDGECVRCVDLDLDVIRRDEDGAVILEDEDEFEAHIASMGYPDALIRQCLDEVETVRQLLAEASGPFSEEVFNWRPGDQQLIRDLLAVGDRI